jgi:hypothetical protein
MIVKTFSLFRKHGMRKDYVFILEHVHFAAGMTMTKSMYAFVRGGGHLSGVVNNDDNCILLLQDPSSKRAGCSQ